METHISFRTTDGVVIVAPRKRLYLISEQDGDTKIFTVIISDLSGTEDYDIDESTFVNLTKLLCKAT